MAELASTPFSGVISFDISDALEDENEQIYLMIGNLTQEEQQEIGNVVSLIDTVNFKELIDFTSQETHVRHKPITER